MATKNVLTATCPSCRTVLQVKTRSAEKTVPCPKCQAAVTVAAPADVSLQGETLPDAALWEAGPQSAGSLGTTATGLPGPIAITIGVSAAVVVFGIGIFFAVRAGNGGLLQPVPVVLNTDKANGFVDHDLREQKNATEVHSGEGGEGGVSPQEFVPQSLPQPIPHQGASGQQAAKAKLDQVLSRIQSLERQKRDWLLANAGPQAARGKKVIIWPQERLLTEARQQYAMAQREYEATK